MFRKDILLYKALSLRLAPRHTKPGTLDQSASTLFVENIEVQAKICASLRELKQVANLPTGNMNVASAIQLLFRTLHGLHSLWRTKTLLTSEECKSYLFLATRFGFLWHAAGWKVSTWVHWVVRHSSALVDLHRTIYHFSSIPTERRNVEFKLDVTHCYKGWKLSHCLMHFFKICC